MLDKLKEQWEQIKESVRDEYDITNVSYNTWIRPLKLYAIEGRTVQIVFPDSEGSNVDFAIGYITKKYALFFQIKIEEFTGFHAEVQFMREPEFDETRLFPKQAEDSPDIDEAVRKANLNPRYTFDTFVVGANNKFAHAASLSVAESPGREYNPLFIYGGPGLGKTHLMQAIANFILNTNPKANILYVSSEVFTNEVIEAIRNNRMTELKNKYRTVDVLLIDDIQFIIGKEYTQEEFFNTFNFLYENRRQIVLASDQSPRNFTTLEERLRSRFEMGLSVDISAPDYETRMAILRKKEEVEGYTIDNEILQYIATNIRTNIRELEGALTKMYAYSKLHQGTTLTLDIARENLKDIVNPDIERKLTPQHIIEVVAEHYGVRPEDIKSQKRTREVVLPRHVAMYLIRVLNDISLQDVGKILGNRDHSTIIHGYEKVIKELKTDKELENTVEILKKKLMQP